MLFPKKIGRIVDVEKSEKTFKKSLENEPLEKGDLKAMIIAALLVFIPATLVLLAIFCGVLWLFFLR